MSAAINVLLTATVVRWREGKEGAVACGYYLNCPSKIRLPFEIPDDRPRYGYAGRIESGPWSGRAVLCFSETKAITTPSEASQLARKILVPSIQFGDIKADRIIWVGRARLFKAPPSYRIYLPAKVFSTQPHNVVATFGRANSRLFVFLEPLTSIDCRSGCDPVRESLEPEGTVQLVK